MNSLHREWKPCAIMLRIQNEITDNVIFLSRVSTLSLTQTWPHKPHEQRANGVQVLCVQILRKCVHVRLHQRLPSKLNIEKMYKIWKIRSWEIRKEKEDRISEMRYKRNSRIRCSTEQIGVKKNISLEIWKYKEKGSLKLKISEVIVPRFDVSVTFYTKNL